MLSRAKNKDTGFWCEGYYACESNHACFGNELKYEHFIFVDEFMDWNLGGLQQYIVDPKTIGRFIGLYDKNGKMIFEGDIVRYVYEPGESFWNANQLSVIKWKDTGFYMDGVKGTNRYALMSGWLVSIPHGDGKCFEVVGNIHDNPELLKGGEPE